MSGTTIQEEMKGGWNYRVRSQMIRGSSTGFTKRDPFGGDVPAGAATNVIFDYGARSCDQVGACEAARAAHRLDPKLFPEGLLLVERLDSGVGATDSTYNRFFLVDVKHGDVTAELVG